MIAGVTLEVEAASKKVTSLTRHRHRRRSIIAFQVLERERSRGKAQPIPEATLSRSGAE
ncbi:MAG: hypothetical protein ACR2HJ_03785 [Fimbriimonadales bacterium]